MRAGARGYILKGADQEEMLRAIRSVANGEALFGPAIATRLMNYFSSPIPNAPPQAFPELTDREREVLDRIAQGLSNKLIAQKSSISEKTIRNHVSNIFSKLQVADRAQAIIRAREAGMGEGDYQNSLPHPSNPGPIPLKAEDPIFSINNHARWSQIRSLRGCQCCSWLMRGYTQKPNYLQKPSKRKLRSSF